MPTRECVSVVKPRSADDWSNIFTFLPRRVAGVCHLMAFDPAFNGIGVMNLTMRTSRGVVLNGGRVARLIFLGGCLRTGKQRGFEAVLRRSGGKRAVSMGSAHNFDLQECIRGGYSVDVISFEAIEHPGLGSRLGRKYILETSTI